MITWYNVSQHGKPNFGFSAKDGKVRCFPEWQFVGNYLSGQMFKHWFAVHNAKAVKIADQYEPGDIQLS